MKRIYTGKNIPDAGLVRAMLEEAGITAEVKNGQLQSMLGEASGIDGRPSVWILHDIDFEKAEAMVEKFLNPSDSAASEKWTCKHCGEMHTAQFKACWKCATQ